LHIGKKKIQILPQKLESQSLKHN